MEEKLREYLDGVITYWRNKKKKTENDEDELIAACYVDAYQSVRVSMLGELLKREE